MTVRTFQMSPKDTGSKGAIPESGQVTWKQMFRVAKVVTGSERGPGAEHEETLTPPLSFSLIPRSQTKA